MILSFHSALSTTRDVPLAARRGQIHWHKRLWIAITIALCSATGCTTLPANEISRIRRANEHYANGRYPDAMRLLNLVIVAHPKTNGVGEAYYIRGLCHLHGQSLEQSKSDFEKALRTSTRAELRARTHAQLGHIFYQGGSFRSAARQYALAIDDFPFKPPKDEIYYRYGDSLQKIGQWKKSRETLPKVWHLFPKSTYEPYARRKFSWPHDYFSIQCGAFRRSSAAHELANKLRRERFSAAVEVDVRGDQALHVVYVGSFPMYGDAEMELQRVLRRVPEAIIAP